MREDLKIIKNVRDRFSGTFERFGTKKNYHGYAISTILLKDIKDKLGKIISDHLWFNHTKGFENLGSLNEGDIVFFDARVTPYIKGYVNNREGIDNREVDYRLSHPTKFIIKRETGIKLF